MTTSKAKTALTDALCVKVNCINTRYDGFALISHW